MIQTTNVSKQVLDGRRLHKVLTDVSFALNKGQSLAITGESGSGKSTLLNLLAALDKPDSGSIVVGDENVTDLSESDADAFRRQQLGVIFQRFNLIDCLSVADNIALPARLKGNIDTSHIDTLIGLLKLDRLTHRLPYDLSGGEQQRVAIARALAHKPALVLADEPTGNLDDANSKVVANLLFDTCRQLATTLVLVTHSNDLASQADRHLHLHNGHLHAVGAE